jgi:hypothetical protein
MPAHAVMGMATVVVIAPNKLSLPPPGAYSCMETELTPKTSRTCFTERPTKAPTMAKATKVPKKGKSNKNTFT